jgi:hypothetical protein
MTWTPSRRAVLGGLAAATLSPRLAAAQSSEPIRIGVLAPLTGRRR